MRRLGEALGSRRGLREVSRSALAAFGIFSTAIQLYLALWTDPPIPGVAIILSSLTLAVILGVYHALPTDPLERNFRQPNFKVSVVIGDLYDQDCHVAIGFTDTFDTDTQDDLVIHASSVQGQLLSRVYSNNRDALDQDLNLALSPVAPLTLESRSAKAEGKLARYQIPTVATIGSPGRRIYCVAYSTLGNDYVATSSVNNLWISLDALWDAAHTTGHRDPLAVPIFGSELARVDSLDREALIKMIILSFVARSRIGVIAQELRIVVHPKDRDHINMIEIRSFIQSL